MPSAKSSTWLHKSAAKLTVDTPAEEQRPLDGPVYSICLQGRRTGAAAGGCKPPAA
jgi:hypothetical protein